jgi:hypothetical protein
MLRPRWLFIVVLYACHHEDSVCRASCGQWVEHCAELNTNNDLDPDCFDCEWRSPAAQIGSFDTCLSHCNAGLAALDGDGRKVVEECFACASENSCWSYDEPECAQICEQGVKYIRSEKYPDAVPGVHYEEFLVPEYGTDAWYEGNMSCSCD